VNTEQTKIGAINVEDLNGGSSFTVSYGGAFGSIMKTPIVNSTQAAFSGMHGIFERTVTIKRQMINQEYIFLL
jgi:pyruvate/2-oxoglutarate dehydrogenase complex dihydrolipoamide acyltransferase (E2) component